MARGIQRPSLTPNEKDVFDVFETYITLECFYMFLPFHFLLSLAGLHSSTLDSLLLKSPLASYMRFWTGNLEPQASKQINSKSDSIISFLYCQPVVFCFLQTLLIQHRGRSQGFARPFLTPDRSIQTSEAIGHLKASEVKELPSRAIDEGLPHTTETCCSPAGHYW